MERRLAVILAADVASRRSKQTLADAEVQLTDQRAPQDRNFHRTDRTKSAYAVNVRCAIWTRSEPILRSWGFLRCFLDALQTVGR